MKVIKGLSFKQNFFYTLVFLIGFLYQPNWVSDNFWLKADFYDSLPFQVHFLLFLFIYSLLSVTATWSLVQVIKKNL